MNITKESWDAMIAGQLRDVRRINDLQERLCKMAKQVERLNWMLEECLIQSGQHVETGEHELLMDWQDEEMYREALKERRE